MNGWWHFVYDNIWRGNSTDDLKVNTFLLSYYITEMGALNTICFMEQQCSVLSENSSSSLSCFSVKPMAPASSAATISHLCLPLCIIIIILSTITAQPKLQNYYKIPNNSNRKWNKAKRKCIKIVHLLALKNWIALNLMYSKTFRFLCLSDFCL